MYKKNKILCKKNKLKGKEIFIVELLIGNKKEMKNFKDFVIQKRILEYLYMNLLV